MSRSKVILGISSAVALSIWIKIQRTRRLRHGQPEPYSRAYRPQWLYRFDIDDDTAAEIIKRARPALELARALY